MKSSFLFKVLTLLAFVCAGASNAFAQGEITASIRIYKFSQESSFGESRSNADKDVTFWYKSNNAWSSFSSSESNRINISYRGPANMVLHKRIADGNDDKSFAPVTTINLPFSSKDIFIIMIASGSTAKFYPINVSPDKLQKGKIAIANMTRRTLGLKFGEDLKSLRPNGHAIFSEPKGRNKGKAVPVMIAARVRGKWEKAYLSRVHYPDNQRCIMLVYDPSNEERPNLNVNIVQF